jgi:hypothetical protein
MSSLDVVIDRSAAVHFGDFFSFFVCALAVVGPVFNGSVCASVQSK